MIRRGERAGEYYVTMREDATHFAILRVMRCRALNGAHCILPSYTGAAIAIQRHDTPAAASFAILPARRQPMLRHATITALRQLMPAAKMKDIVARFGATPERYVMPLRRCRLHDEMRFSTRAISDEFLSPGLRCAM